MRTFVETFPTLGKFLYQTKTPDQTRTKPLEVICVGISRSGTESLQQALIHLGYDHTYHGWDIPMNDGHHEAWTRLSMKKYTQVSGVDGEACLTASDFDPIIGHCAAITDAPAAIFAQELIDAYPDAKVILNTRSDLDKWYASMANTFLANPLDSPFAYLWSYFSAAAYWRRLIFSESFYKFFYGDIRATAKWRYRAHVNEIRGILSKQPERSLEWKVEDGWEPLCRFLEKEVPKEEFPRGNAPKDFNQSMARSYAKNQRQAERNLMLFGTVLAGISCAVLWTTGWLLPSITG